MTYRYAGAPVPTQEPPKGTDSATAAGNTKPKTSDPLDYGLSRVLKVTYTRTRNIIHEAYVFENGKRGDKWIVKGLQLTGVPD